MDALLRDLNKRLAAVYQEAEAANLQINWDGNDGCPPCNTLDEDDSCVGCPYRLRDLGYQVGAPYSDA